MLVLQIFRRVVYATEGLMRFRIPSYPFSRRSQKLLSGLRNGSSYGGVGWRSRVFHNSKTPICLVGHQYFDDPVAVFAALVIGCKDVNLLR